MLKTELFKNVTQFIMAMIIAWIILYLPPSKIIFEFVQPISFLLLFWLVCLSIVARGWPFAPPDGSWKPGKSKLSAGILMTLLNVLLAILSTIFVTKIYPGIPLFPVTGDFASIIFITMIWYAFIWGSYPVSEKSAIIRILASIIIVVAIASIIWYTLVNYNGSPFENTPFIPNGLFPANFTVGLMVWFLVWVMIFSNTLQGYPFQKLRAPLDRILQTVLSAILGWICWTVTVSYMSPIFSFAGIGGSIIAWALYHAGIFHYYPHSKQEHPKRSIYNLITVGVLAAIWTLLLRIIMLPIQQKAILSGLPIDISLIGMFYSLNIVATLLIMHNSYWFKFPFSIPVITETTEQSKEYA